MSDRSILTQSGDRLLLRSPGSTGDRGLKNDALTDLFASGVLVATLSRSDIHYFIQDLQARLAEVEEVRRG